MTTTLLPPVLPLAPVAAVAPGLSRSLAERLNGMTEEEFYVFCQRNAELKFERRADGTIEFLDMTGGTTGRRNSELITELTIWNRQRRPGQVFDSSTGFRLPNGAVRAPDAAWVRTEAWQALSTEQQDKFPPLCPDFVVELASPSDTLPDLVVKLTEYISNGCRLAWLIDPKTETVRVFKANGAVAVVASFAETLTGEDVLPGFSFKLSLLK